MYFIKTLCNQLAGFAFIVESMEEMQKFLFLELGIGSDAKKWVVVYPR
jgi:hypothetical protein